MYLLGRIKCLQIADLCLRGEKTQYSEIAAHFKENRETT